MTRADPADFAESRVSRAQERERARAERVECDYLIARLGVLRPNFDCFCGSLEDLRRTVADLERKTGSSRPAWAAPSQGVPRPDPVVVAKVAAARAGQRVDADTDPGELRDQQMLRWHAADRAHELGADADTD